MSANLLLLATLLPVILNFGCILMYLIYQKCRVRTQEEGSADWDDVIWFRLNPRDNRSLFSGVREPGTVTPRRRSLNSMKYPPDSSGFEKRSFAYLQKTYSRCDNTCCICLEEYEETAILTKLPCNHWMHSECIEKWFNRDVTCPLCKEIAIEKPYNEAVVPLPDSIDANSDSGTSNNSRSSTRRPSLSRLIRDTLDQHAEVYFMYNSTQGSGSGIMGFMRNLLQNTRRLASRHQRNGSGSSNGSRSGMQEPVDEDVPPAPNAETLEQDLSGMEGEDVLDIPV